MAEEDMESPWVRVMAFVPISTYLLVFLFACTAQHTPRSGTEGVLRPEFPVLVKTSPNDCKEQGGRYRAPNDTLLGDCLLLGPAAGRIGPPSILISAYDYFYKAGTESPGYGLYSYVLFPLYSPRAERFLEALFQTTSYNWRYELREALNVIYLPTRADKLPSLIRKIRKGSAPAVSPFAATFYDYALARRFLVQICTAPAEVIRDLCATDLSRGPYLFTYAHPASDLSPVPPPYLLLDLSKVHTRAFGEVISAYKEQIKRPDYTDRERIDTLRLHVLNLVLTAADWIAPTKGAIAEILHMVQNLQSGAQTPSVQPVTSITPNPQPMGTSCSLYDEKTALPAGYGSPMHTYPGNDEPNRKTVDAYCNNGAVTAIIKKPSSTYRQDFKSYIHTTGYQYNVGTRLWDKITYACDSEIINGVWCKGNASATLNPSHPYFVAFTCSVVNNKWWCGCREPGDCSQNRWQLQKFNVNTSRPQLTQSAGGVPSIYSSQMIDVKFREGTDVDPPKETLPPDLQGAVANIRPAFTLSEDELRRIGADKLRFWFRLTLHPNVNSVQFMERLKRLESVEHAEFVHLSPLPAGN